MRTILLLSAVAVVAACSDDRAMTAPTSNNRPSTATRTPVTPAIAPQASVFAATSFTSLNTVVGATQTVLGMPGSQTATSTATCPAGSYATGGGVVVTRGGQKRKVTTSAPNDGLTAWSVTGEWGGDMYNMSDWGEFKATVICIQ